MAAAWVGHRLDRRARDRATAAVITIRTAATTTAISVASLVGGISEWRGRRISLVIAAAAPKVARPQRRAVKVGNLGRSLPCGANVGGSGHAATAIAVVVAVVVSVAAGTSNNRTAVPVCATTTTATPPTATTAAAATSTADATTAARCAREALAAAVISAAHNWRDGAPAKAGERRHGPCWPRGQASHRYAPLATPVTVAAVATASLEVRVVAVYRTSRLIRAIITAAFLDGFHQTRAAATRRLSINSGA